MILLCLFVYIPLLSPAQPCCPFFMKTIMKLHRFMRSHHISHSFESKSKVGIPLESKQQNSRNLSLAERRETGHEVTPVLNIFTMIWLGTLVWMDSCLFCGHIEYICLLIFNGLYFPKFTQPHQENERRSSHIFQKILLQNVSVPRNTSLGFKICLLEMFW